MNRAACRAAALRLALIVAPLVCSLGCAIDNPSYCVDDDVCAERRAKDPNVGPVCHRIGHFCTQVCTGNDYCADETKPGYSPSLPICNAKGACEGAGTDGGTKRTNGMPCSEGIQCESGLCEKGRCCDTSCGGPCRSCQKGTCEVVAPGGACQDSSKLPSCASREGYINAWVCTVDQLCEQREQRCGGFLCDATSGRAACLATCSSPAQCESTFTCELSNNTCVGQEPLGADCGDNDMLCLSGMCTDMHCCSEADCGACKFCGTDGKCQNHPAGTEPNGRCGGHPMCIVGAGECDANGNCTYAPAGTPCGDAKCSTTTPGMLDEEVCDGKGGCIKRSTPCAPYVCEDRSPQPSVCKSSCQSVADCESGGACDRRNAHSLDGNVGECLAASDVLVLPNGQSLAQGIAALGTRQVLRVPGGTFAESLNIGSGTVRIIADGPTTIEPGAASPAAQLSGGATLQLQGVTVSGGTSGVICSGQSKLVVLDSTIRMTSGVGIDSNKCDVTLRRSTLLSNGGGGADLIDGQIVVSNNVFAANGALGVTPLGGLRVTRSAGAVTLRNNTFHGNISQSSSGSAVACVGSVTIDSSIVYGNATPEQSGCTFSNSIAPSGVGGTNNENADPMFEDIPMRDYRVKVGSPAIDRGDPNASASSAGTIDRDGSARIQGGRIDRGAYERQ
ncbi:MAG: right-handed parallel beta-helix repeat-containing protein [Myxococcales bacterium]|nr:right-handed parallel beta-helix repeat-containing protein [Myxococcales bacterium]